MNQNLELKLQAWVDGELPDAEARSVGAAIAADPEASRLVAELQTLHRVLAGNETPQPVPETREFYWSKIERQIERAGRNPRPATAQPAWRRWMATLAGVGSLACIVFLALKPMGAPTFDEISATGDGIEAVTFHDQAAGMTVVWLSDSSDDSAQAPDVIPTPTPDTPTQDGNTGDSEVEMD